MNEKLIKTVNDTKGLIAQANAYRRVYVEVSIFDLNEIIFELEQLDAQVKELKHE